MRRLEPEDLLLVLGARPRSDVGAWLRDGLRDAVAAGRLEPGAALPSSRAASAGLGVARRADEGPAQQRLDRRVRQAAGDRQLGQRPQDQVEGRLQRRLVRTGGCIGIGSGGGARRTGRKRNVHRLAGMSANEWTRSYPKMCKLHI